MTAPLNKPSKLPDTSAPQPLLALTLASVELTYGSPSGPCIICRRYLAAADPSLYPLYPPTLSTTVYALCQGGSEVRDTRHPLAIASTREAPTLEHRPRHPTPA